MVCDEFCGFEGANQIIIADVLYGCEMLCIQKSLLCQRKVTSDNPDEKRC